MQRLDTFAAMAAIYSSQQDAESDYESVKSLYREAGIETFDAAVIEKDDSGKVKIVKMHEQPTRTGARLGGGVGLAGGLALALFPAIGIGVAIAGAGLGAGFGALAGHAAGGMSRSDLKDLGETLDTGQCALVVVAASAIGDRVEGAMTRAERIERKELTVDPEAIEADVRAASAGVPQD